jgi:hypothetical protein
MDIKKGRYE